MRTRLSMALALGLTGALAGLAAVSPTWAAEKKPAAAAVMKHITVNVNTADQKALMGLGFDAATADEIIAVRDKNGPFQKKEDLLQIKGIDQVKFDAIKGKIEVK